MIALGLFIGIGVIVLVILIGGFTRTGYTESYKQRSMKENNHDRDLRVFDKNFRK